MSEIIFQAFFFRIEKKDLIFTNLGKQEFFLHRAENIIATYSNLLPKKNILFNMSYFISFRHKMNMNLIIYA